MLEHLFGSKTRVKLLRVFLNNPDKAYFVRELSRRLKLQINSIRRELQNLEKMGIIKIFEEEEVQERPRPFRLRSRQGKRVILRRRRKSIQKKFFKADTDCILYNDLRSILIKGQFLLEKSFIKKLTKLGSINYLVLSGIFVGYNEAPTDILLVGRINKDKLKRLIRSFEKELDGEIKFTIFSNSELEYRRNIVDKFLYDILDNKKIVLIDKCKK